MDGKQKCDALSEKRTVIFKAPHKVQVEQTPLPTVPHTEVLISTTYSLISAGTELLAYTGHMPPTLPTDSIIPTQSLPFNYPTSYGYAAVGRIQPPSTDPSPGTRVFAFREHTSHFSSPPALLHPIPSDISDRDAAFLPTVETALSLATDAALLPGETAVVAGQGAVGLLLVAVLKRLHPYSFVLALDPKRPRRQLALAAGADAALDPTAASFPRDAAAALGAGADVAIDVSGAAGGLDAAVGATRAHGRVVLGSWFGTRPVALHGLGGRFHRSHITLVASQVSDIPPLLAGRWSKRRRFDLAWRLLADIRPAELLPVEVVPVAEAPRAYARLAEGAALAVLLEY